MFNSGAAYIFQFNGKQWIEQQKLTWLRLEQQQKENGLWRFERFINHSPFSFSMRLEDRFTNLVPEEKRAFKSSEELEEEGVKMLKRKALGLCGQETRKTPAEMVAFLIATGFARDEQDPKRAAQALVEGREFSYSPYHSLGFARIQKNGQREYLIAKLGADQ